MRMSGHRGNFYKVLAAHNDVDESKDDYSLGLHYLVHEHHSIDRGDFNKHFQLQILENCSPSSPVGLNNNNPFGLSILT